jgi:hypothetical protein
VAGRHGGGTVVGDFSSPPTHASPKTRGRSRTASATPCSAHRCGYAGTSPRSPSPMSWTSSVSTRNSAPDTGRGCSPCSPHGWACSATPPGSPSRRP